MRHRKHGRRLGRKPAHRAALRRNMLRDFLRHETLVTTLAKAKEMQPRVEKLISLGRTRSLAAIRRALGILGHDRELVTKLFEDIGPRFADRPGGYTRLLKFSKPRLGDAAPRARLELVTEELAERPASKPVVVEEVPEQDQAPTADEQAPTEQDADTRAELEGEPAVAEDTDSGADAEKND